MCVFVLLYFEKLNIRWGIVSTFFGWAKTWNFAHKKIKLLFGFSSMLKSKRKLMKRFLEMKKLLGNLKALRQLKTMHAHTCSKHKRWNNHFNFTSLSLRTRLHYILFLKCTRKVESSALGKFFYDLLHWKLGFKLMNMQNTSAMFLRWQYQAIHIKTMSLLAEERLCPTI